MAKMITRTIITHEIILGEVHGTEVKVLADNVIHSATPMQKRQLDKLSKEAGCPVVVISDTIVEEKRAMSLDAFILHSEIVDVNEETEIED